MHTALLLCDYRFLVYIIIKSPGNFSDIYTILPHFTLIMSFADFDVDLMPHISCTFNKYMCLSVFYYLLQMNLGVSLVAKCKTEIVHAARACVFSFG